MGKDAADEVVCHLRQAEAAAVVFVEEKVLAGFGVGQVVVDVAAAASAVG